MYRILLLFFCYVQSGFSQDYYFKHYTADDGLSRNTVFCTLLSEKGFLWIGTKDGLNRFDGYRFKIFNKNDKNNGLRSNYITSLHEYEGTLWVGTDKGLYSYDENSESFQLLPTSSNESIEDIEHDHNGNLWFISGATLHKYNISRKKLCSYNPKTFFFADDITVTEAGYIWIGHDDSLFNYNEESETFKTYKIKADSFAEQSLKITKLFSLNQQTLLVGSESHGAFEFDINSHVSKALFATNRDRLFIRDFALNNSDELWIATESGIYIHNLNTKLANHLTNDPGNPYSLSDNAVYALTLDNEGGMWVGTYFKGLNYFPRHDIHFTRYFPQSGKNAIRGSAVREIRSNGSNYIWIGTEDAGLNGLNTKTGIIEQFGPKKSKKGLSSYNIHALLVKNSLLYIGTFQRGLDVMDTRSKKIIEHFGKGEKNSIPSDFVLSLMETKSGQLIAATASGVHVHDSFTNSFINYPAFPEGVFFTSILEDEKNSIWAGSFGKGLYKYDQSSDTRKIYKHFDSVPSSISSNSMNGIFQDSGNTIWICTEDGLNKFDEKTDSFIRYGIEQGFPSTIFYAILEDDNGHLWVSTSKGLVDFDPFSTKLKVYTKANGLLNDQFNYSSAYKDSDGTMYFGSIGGMISFKPTKEIDSIGFIPPLYITNIQINRNNGAIEKFSGIPKITSSDMVLDPDQSSLSIEFSALSYTAPELTEYWYKLKGHADTWTYLNHTPQINFTALASGDYILDIKSKNIHGLTSRLVQPLHIELLPTFWKSYIAYLLYMLLVGFLGFLIFKFFYIKARAKNYRLITELKNRKNKEIFQAKIEFFTNVSHEIRTPLTLIKTPLEKLLRKSDRDLELKENLSIMEKNTNRLLDLSNQLLNFRQAEIENISLTFVNTNISSLVQGIYVRFSQSIMIRDMFVQLDLGDTDLYAYVDKEAMTKIISNLFSNALKYGELNILVKLQSDTDNFEMSIENDGPVIPSHLKKKIFEPFFRNNEIGNQRKSGFGLGLALANSLAELHNGRLFLDTSVTINRFVLQIPIHQKNEITLYDTKNLLDFKSELPNVKRDLLFGMKSTLLLVDDNIDLLDFLAKDLSDEYIVLKATNANQGLELIKIEPISLIISDVMMSGMDGFEFCEKVKSEIESSHIPVILLTAKSTMEAKLRGLCHGADAYIEKPFSIDHLKVRITNLIENRIKIIKHFSHSPLAHIRSMAQNKTDEDFIGKLDVLIGENISNPDFNIDTMAENLNMSRSSFYRKIRELSNLNPSELLNLARLKKAAELLKSDSYKIYQIADMVGYKSQSSFGRNFHKQFGMTASQYIRS